VGILLQIASNLANDVFDYEHGTDTPERLGPTRVTQAGILSPRQVKAGLAVVVGLAVLIGIYLTVVAGWPVILIGTAAIVSAILYTAGPYPLGYYGFGDLFVFLFFGLAAVAGTYFIQALQTTPAVWGMAVVIGLLVVNLLVVNNLRDIPTDTKTGKRTLAVRIGVRGSQIEYLVLQVISYLLIPVFILLGWIPTLSFLTWLTIPYAYRMTKGVFTRSGKALNPILAGTSKLAFYVGILFLAGKHRTCQHQSKEREHNVLEPQSIGHGKPPHTKIVFIIVGTVYIVNLTVFLYSVHRLYIIGLHDKPGLDTLI
jgi:1,4-dihydroxy-2-naphthoate octaprenyltransferase